MIDGTAQVAKEPERWPVAAAARLARAELDDAAGEAELVPRLQHRRAERHVDVLLARRRVAHVGLVLRLDQKRGHAGELGVALNGGLLGEVECGALVGRVPNLQRRPPLVQAVAELATLLVELVGEDEVVHLRVGTDTSAHRLGGVGVAPAARLGRRTDHVPCQRQHASDGCANHDRARGW